MHVFEAKTMTRTFRLEIEPYQTTSNSKFVRPDWVEGLHFQETSTGIWPNAIEHLWQTNQHLGNSLPTGPTVFLLLFEKGTPSLKPTFFNAYEEVEDKKFCGQIITTPYNHMSPDACKWGPNCAVVSLVNSIQHVDNSPICFQ